MSRKITFWITLIATCFTMEVGATDAPPIIVTSVPDDDFQWPEIMYFPDANDEPVPGKIYGEAVYVQATRDDVTFVLYTRRGPATGEILKLGDAEMLRRSSFDRLKPTVFVTHGFQSSAQSLCVQGIKNMYMGFHEVNLIAVDWSRIASSINYFVVKQQTIPVGGFVAEFVHFLQVWGGVDLGNIHLIGHSLGAHVMGIAAKTFRNQPRKVGRITVKLGTCSHSRAWQFYAESINSADFTSLPCTSYDDFKNSRNCNILLKAPMGMPAPARIIGNYFLLTASAPPFALGG